MGTYTDKIQKYFPFTFLELRNIIVTILIIGFIWGFNDGRKEFIPTLYFYNMLVSIAIVAVSMLVFVSGQRFAGLSAGYRVEFRMWWPGLILALIVCFISRGYIAVPLAGGMIIHHMAAHRLGFFRYGLNMRDNGVIAMCGPLAAVAFATIIQQMHIWLHIFPEPIVTKIYWFNLIFALVNMLPIPPLAGASMLYQSRLPYIFTIGFMICYSIMAYFSFFSWILALIGAFIIWLIYYIKVEPAK